MFGSSQDRARQLAGRNRRERISSISSRSSSRSVSSSSRAPPPRNYLSTPDSTTKLPSAIEEYAAGHENGTVLDTCAVKSQKQRLVEDEPPLSASQVASGQGGSQVEHHRLQAEHLSQVLYNGFALVASVSPPQSQFSSTHQVQHGSVGWQPDNLLHPRNITASDPPYHLVTSSLLDLLDLFSVNTKDALGAFISEHDPSLLAIASLRGGSGGNGGDSLPAMQPLGGTFDEEFTIWIRHVCMLDLKLDLDISGAYHDNFVQESQHRLTSELRSELVFLHRVPNYQNIYVTSGHQYTAFRRSLSTRKLVRFDLLFGPPFPKDPYTAIQVPCVTFFHSLDNNQKDRFGELLHTKIRELRLPVETSLPQPPVSLHMLSFTFVASVQLNSLR